MLKIKFSDEKKAVSPSFLVEKGSFGAKRSAKTKKLVKLIFKPHSFAAFSFLICYDFKMDKKIVFCQSCGMPLLDKESLGTNEDGTPNPQYCAYCFQKGDFTADLTIDEMIETCVPFMMQGHPELSSRQAHEMMRLVLSSLKRWKKNN